MADDEIQIWFDIIKEDTHSKWDEEFAADINAAVEEVSFSMSFWIFSLLIHFL